jgi:hypothetical protein
MEYRFGPGKPLFNGTRDEWNKLKEEIAWWNEETSKYPIIIVLCPHCGTKNTHNISEEGLVIHRECQLMIDKKGLKIYYDCPGYITCKSSNNKKIYHSDNYLMV